MYKCVWYEAGRCQRNNDFTPIRLSKIEPHHHVQFNIKDTKYLTYKMKERRDDVIRSDLYKEVETADIVNASAHIPDSSKFD